MIMSNKQKFRPILLCDTREKYPFDFEGDDDFSEIVYTKLEAGDYSIRGIENECVIERKKSVNELLLNFIQNKDRIIHEAERLKKYKLKVIIVEEPIENIFNPMKYFLVQAKKTKMSPNALPRIVISGLVDLLVRFNIHVIFAGSYAKHLTKKILLDYYKHVAH